MDNLDTFMDQATISFLGLFNLLESDGKLKKFITLLSLISLVSGIFPFFCGTKYIQSKNRENIPALVIQSITLGIKASSLWKTFIEMSQFETHMEKFKVNFKNTSSTDNSTNFISAIGDTAMEIFSQKNVYFPLLAAGFSFIILQVIASFHPLNEGHGELKNPFATTIWYLIPFLVLFLSESVTIELFKANVLSNSYLRTVIFRYIARGLSMGYGLCAIMGLSELYGFIGSGLYGLFLPIGKCLFIIFVQVLLFFSSIFICPYHERICIERSL